MEPAFWRGAYSTPCRNRAQPSAADAISAVLAVAREIEMLKFKSFRIDIGRREQALRAQLQTLAA